MLAKPECKSWISIEKVSSPVFTYGSAEMYWKKWRCKCFQNPHCNRMAKMIKSFKKLYNWFFLWYRNLLLELMGFGSWWESPQAVSQCGKCNSICGSCWINRWLNSSEKVLFALEIASSCSGSCLQDFIQPMITMCKLQSNCIHWIGN